MAQRVLRRAVSLNPAVPGSELGHFLDVRGVEVMALLVVPLEEAGGLATVPASAGEGTEELGDHSPFCPDYAGSLLSWLRRYPTISLMVV